jgi:hypothetical protein
MRKDELRYELSAEGAATVDAVDAFLEERIRTGDPIEALIATKRLGDIASHRAKEAARAATEGAWSWSDVGRALGMTKQAAHEKLRARVQDELATGLAKLAKAEEMGHAKIARRAERGRDRLDRVPPISPKVESARERIDEWERSEHEKLSRKVEQARETIARAENSVEEKLNREG